MPPGRALSDDLRERVIIACHQRTPGTTLVMIASRFQVSLSTVKRWVEAERTGAERPPRGHRSRLLQPEDEEVLRSIYVLRKSLYLDEGCEQLYHYTGLNVSKATLWRYLSRAGITHKKLETRHCAPAGLEEFELMQPHIRGESCVWIDEVGLDLRDRYRRYGWSERGMCRLLVGFKISVYLRRYSGHCCSKCSSHSRRCLKIQCHCCDELLRSCCVCNLRHNYQHGPLPALHAALPRASNAAVSRAQLHCYSRQCFLPHSKPCCTHNQFLWWCCATPSNV